jgi:hypothetical protein
MKTVVFFLLYSNFLNILNGSLAVTGADERNGSLIPFSLVAITRNSYSCPSSKDGTVNVVSLQFCMTGIQASAPLDVSRRSTT